MSIIKCSFSSLSVFNKDSSINQNKNNSSYVHLLYSSHKLQNIFMYIYIQTEHIKFLTVVTVRHYYFHFSAEECVTQRTLAICLSSCVYSFNKYLFSTYCVLSIELGAGIQWWAKIDRDYHQTHVKLQLRMEERSMEERQFVAGGADLFTEAKESCFQEESLDLILKDQ